MESSSDPMRDFAKNIDCQVDNLITVKMPREIIKVNEFFDKYKDMTFDQYKRYHELNCEKTELEAASSSSHHQSKSCHQFSTNQASSLNLHRLIPECNRSLCDLAAEIKRFVYHLLGHTNLLKLWLNTQNAKKTADNGNSFGNDLQRRVTEDSKSLENYLSTVFIRFTHQQIPKHPFRRDLGETSADVDAPVEIMGETEYRVLRSILIRVRDSYLDLHDLLKRHREQKSNSAE